MQNPATALKPSPFALLVGFAQVALAKCLAPFAKLCFHSFWLLKHAIDWLLERANRNYDRFDTWWDS